MPGPPQSFSHLSRAVRWVFLALIWIRAAAAFHSNCPGCIGCYVDTICIAWNTQYTSWMNGSGEGRVVPTKKKAHNLEEIVCTCLAPIVLPESVVASLFEDGHGGWLYIVMC